MYNINFLKEFLNEKNSKEVEINISGILEFKIDIFNFNYRIQKNELVIRDGEKICLKIIFDEVREVKNIDNKICIEFNIKQSVYIQ